MKLVPPDEPPEAPLEERPDATPFSAPPISLSDVRIARGLPALGRKPCDHHQLIYNPETREIWCKSCSRMIDGFDAFHMLVKRFHDLVAAADSRMAAAREAGAAVLVRRAAKQLDRDWGGKMAPSCPHCRGGLLPEDFEHRRSATSREFELARRKRAAERTP
jgi:hypothetical protein